MPPAEMTMPCPVCGLPIQSDAGRCAHCHTDFSSTTMGLGDASTLVRLKTTEPLNSQDLVEDLVESLSPRFQGMRRLGQGGMGLVYIARDPLLKRDVAIKVLAPEFREDHDARERFVREAQAAAAVAHPNVVGIFQVGELNKSRIPYFVMQFIEGSTVEDAYPHGTPVPEPAARRIIAEIAAALAAAHKRGMVHRDIKPANVMVDSHTGRAVVLDFGISASVQRQSNVEKLTATGVYIGTPRYMSPEQAAGEQVTEKSDVYSLGCVAYELLTGGPVFTEKNVLGLFAAHMRDTPKPLLEVRPGLDRELVALVTRCLDKDPSKRPDADEVSRRLAPGGTILLEWPPPGLEGMLGAGKIVLRPLWAGIVTLLAVVVPLIWAGSTAPAIADSVLMLVVYVIALPGVVLVLSAIWRGLRVGRAASAAVRNGYGWMTVIEVIADYDGETGGLIAGSRRFAALTPVQRSTLRNMRVRRAGALLLGAALPLVALQLMFILANLASLGHQAVVLLLLFPSAAVAFVLQSDLQERRLAPREDARREEVDATLLRRLIPEWYLSFERARASQALGEGSRRGERRGIALATVFAVIAIVLVMSLVPLGMIAAVNGSLLQRGLSRLSDSDEKARIADVARPYALPKDSSLTPRVAGIAFLAMGGYQSGFPGMLPYPPLVERTWDHVKMADGLFKNLRGGAWLGPSSTGILEAASHGVSPDELAYMSMVAKAPIWNKWNVLARARQFDMLGATFVLPLDDKAFLPSMPIPRYTATKEVAYASVTRAAYFLAQKQLDSAEFTLRSTISVGLTFADGANSVFDRLIAFVITGIGRDALARFYTITGNPEGARLRAHYDSVSAVFNSRQERVAETTASGTSTTMSLPVARARTVALAMDNKTHRSMRMEALQLLSLTRCTNLRELAFGSDNDVRKAFQVAEKELVRFPSDMEYIRLARETVERTPTADAVGIEVSPFMRWIGYPSLSVAEAVTRNPRIRGCANWASMFDVLI